MATGGYFVHVRSVGIKALRNRLSEYVRLAAAGETVLVTDRDKVVAELTPPRADRRPDVSDAVLADLIRNGWLTPAASPRTPLPSRKPATASLEEVLEELDEDRSERS